MIRVNIIGQGNLATHLISAFKNSSSIVVNLINSRNILPIPTADITIISVADDAIKLVSEQIRRHKSLVVHTSGTVSIEAVLNQRKGVFYPLQTFTKGTQIDFTNIPFCIETSENKDFELLSKLANALQAKVYRISTEQRKKLHIAAVFANNFSNHMFAIANAICEQHNVPFEILHPLIKETSAKITKIAPKMAQTGPAKRNDLETIENHLEQLNLQQQEMYKLITKSIQEN